jgi:hypothetical protein
MFDGPATLTMMAADTSRIRVGTLVTSLYFRQPVTFAKAAVTVDHLGGGRKLALGVGDPSAGARAGGLDWPAGERVARFRVGRLSEIGIDESSCTGRRPGGRRRRGDGLRGGDRHRDARAARGDELARGRTSDRSHLTKESAP